MAPPRASYGSITARTWRSGEAVFHDVALSDTRMQEAIYTVHSLLNGILVETVLEPGSFDVQRYLRRLQRILLDMLAP